MFKYLVQIFKSNLVLGDQICLASGFNSNRALNSRSNRSQFGLPTYFTKCSYQGSALNLILKANNCNPKYSYWGSARVHECTSARGFCKRATVRIKLDIRIKSCTVPQTVTVYWESVRAASAREQILELNPLVKTTVSPKLFTCAVIEGARAASARKQRAAGSEKWPSHPQLQTGDWCIVLLYTLYCISS